jgi:hypothetical protein
MTSAYRHFVLIEHVAMLPSMLVTTLLRREEYSGAHDHAELGRVPA